MNMTDVEIKKILENYKQLVVLGLSPKPDRPSHKVPLFLKSKGYDIVGVYPQYDEISGFKIYSHLSEVPVNYRKFVDVFQKSERIPEIVEDIINLGGVEVLWLQLGVSHPEAEKKAEQAGIKVISNRCPHIEYERLFT